MESIKLIFLSILISLSTGCTRYIHPHVPLPAKVEVKDFNYSIANRDQNITKVIRTHTKDFIIVDKELFYRYESDTTNCILNDISSHAIADHLNNLADNEE